ncbi:anillin isoform X2 [Pangasianodon hypophthalmus]|uniref:anillin isoform X2 n=1 Tax=Pangasianodon hypophthalmus TaxID=310915 RepID=UPI0023080A1E|nr:anillin isoform X2 [Pangasianodon hypophthalmus]
MDPFTEKLLERTRARRENLQKKMAERPTAANRQMTKRSREPLTETNSVVSQPPAEKVLPPSKPSPSKRRCSEENARFTGEENKEPMALQVTASDPATDKKPPIAPSSIRSATAERLAVHSSSDSSTGLAHPPPGNEKMEACPSQTITGCTDKVIKHSMMEESSEALKGDPAPTPAASGMKCRLQRLAEQRHYWDSEGSFEPVPNSAALSPVKSQRMEIATNPAPAITSEKPLGRKGRLANLAATISSWEDDLGHPPTYRDNAQGQPGTACVPPPARVGMNTSVKTSAAAQQAKSIQPVASKPVHSAQQPPVYSPVRSSRVIPPSPQKTEMPEPKLAKGHLSPASSPLKSFSSQHSTPVKSGRVPSSPQTSQCSQSPLKTQAPCKELGPGKVVNASPAKTNVPANSSSSVVLPQATERLNKDTTPLQKSGPVGPAGGVKSFLERFGEKCQERNQGSPLNGVGLARTPAATPSSTHKSRLLQERLTVTHGASSTTLLTQKQKMEREAELAQVRSRFQNSKMSKSREDLTEDTNNSESKELEEPNKKSVPVLNDEPLAPQLDILHTKFSENETSNIKPVLSSPMKKVDVPLEKAGMDEQREKETEEEIHEIEMNVDGSINSEVINHLFEDVLEENDEHDAEEDEEEDALNISSMSLLTPLAETVAAVVKSPERKVMTSTPASSFIEKNKTPEGVSRPTKFQRTRMLRAGSSDSIETLEEEHKLPYSIDAYRSTRVKETERPEVKQVIVRKEDVSQRMEEPRNTSHTSIKQKMQVLTNEMNMQQTVIHQASQALNCCTDEEHGKGSQVEAEAERLLLIATERRVALKAALDRLKAEGPAVQKKSSSKAQDDMGVPASKGSITLQELRLPLKADFVCSAANKPESGSHYFFVMIRAGAENTVATPLANTNNALSGDALTFSTKFTLPDVSSDFEIDIEVYYLVLKRELFADKRKKPAKSKAITPKRFLAITKSNLQTPVVASPGGPNAVRTSNFALVGSHKLTLAAIGKNKFPLEKIRYEGCESRLLSDMFQNKVPFLCPLEGHIYLKMQCEVDSHVQERGFLTMFEDVSGFGAWHRRWCVLSGYCISYWTYPDDEKRKNPIGRINLASCTSRKVEPANREFCARPNTFELITVRPQRDDDKETLVSQCKNTMCVTKNWLSADTKEERNLWMRKLNQILVDLRMWQPDSCYRPV